MPFPKTEAELITAGYHFESVGICRGCHAKFEWWQTPKGRMMPLDIGTLEPHWATCPQRELFGKKKGHRN